jgi:hypothetical protein
MISAQVSMITGWLKHHQEIAYNVPPKVHVPSTLSVALVALAVN